MTSLPPMTNCCDLIDRYDTLLFDAYGVLISNQGTLPHARELIDHLNRIHKPYYVVTNGSRNSPAETAARYQGYNLAIAVEQVVTSGSLVPPWIKANGYESARFMILGPPPCHYILDDFPAAKAVSLDSPDFDVLIIGNQDGFPLREVVDHVISVLFRYVDAGKSPPLILPNPDLIYPDGPSTYGITGGMIAHMIEAAMAIRYPYLPPQFIRLGKPYAPIFEEAKQRAGSGSFVMVGDQMVTDIRGALDNGMAAALIATGLSRIDDPTIYNGYSPTYCLRDLALS